MGNTFLCDNCGAYFAEPRKVVETHGFEVPPFEIFSVCPKCGYGNYAYTERCTECNRYINGDYVQTKNGWICDFCYIIKNIFEDQP